MDDRNDMPPTVTAKVEFGTPPWRFQTKVTVPTGPVRVRQMLPVIQALSDAMVGAVAQDAEQNGHAISCRKGCGACCRQMVPVSGVEARRLAEMIDSFPEPRRTQVLTRFADTLRRLAEAGLLDKLRHPEQWTEEELKTYVQAYFDLGTPCPFLEEEACSIHAERPVSCREFLVTTPAELCAGPTHEAVRSIVMPFKMWWALARFESQPAESPALPWAPLIMCLEWSEQHPDEAEPRPGPELLAELFSKLTGKQTPAPPLPF